MDAGAETLNSAKNLEGCCIQSMMSVYSGSYELVHFVTCWNHRCSATGAQWSTNPWKWANVHSLFNLVKNKSQSWLKHVMQESQRSTTTKQNGRRCHVHVWGVLITSWRQLVLCFDWLVIFWTGWSPTFNQVLSYYWPKHWNVSL